MKYIVHIERHATERIELEAESQEKARDLALQIMSCEPVRDIEDSVHRIEEVPGDGTKSV